MTRTNRKQMYLLKDLSEAVAESLAILEQVRDKKLVVCNSGGKDSSVTEDLCKKAGVDYDSVYNVTTIDPPEAVRFIHKNYPETIFSKPKASFYELVKTNFSPAIKKRRWCCSQLKEYPLPGYDFKVEGIRAEESKGRQGRKLIDTKRKVVYPIYYWAEWHIWEYIRKNNLPYCSLYDEGYDRIGCVPCPFHSYRQHLKDMKRWPHIYRKFKEAITIYAKNNGYTWTADEWLDQYIKKKGMVDL